MGPPPVWVHGSRQPTRRPARGPTPQGCGAARRAKPGVDDLITEPCHLSGECVDLALEIGAGYSCVDRLDRPGRCRRRSLAGRSCGPAPGLRPRRRAPVGWSRPPLPPTAAASGPLLARTDGEARRVPAAPAVWPARRAPPARQPHRGDLRHPPGACPELARRLRDDASNSNCQTGRPGGNRGRRPSVGARVGTRGVNRLPVGCSHEANQGGAP